MPRVRNVRSNRLAQFRKSLRRPIMRVAIVERFLSRFDDMAGVGKSGSPISR